MATAHTPKGFTGSVDQTAEARRFFLGGIRFRVEGPSHWQLSASGTTARTVNIAPGRASCCGVWDSTTAVDTVTVAANATSSDRLDAVVATFDWSNMTVAFKVIQGGPNQVPLVNSNGGNVVDNSRVNRLPGVRYDAILGYVRVRPGVNNLASGDIYDLRPWGGYGGALSVPQTQLLINQDMDPVTRIFDTSRGHHWIRKDDNLWFDGWVGTNKASQPLFSMLNGSIVIGSNPTVFTRVTFPTRTDMTGGMMSYNGSTGQLIMNAHGKVRVDAVAGSDAGSAGGSMVEIDYPTGGNMASVPNMAYRGQGFPWAGTLWQPINAGPIHVAPGDAIGLRIWQTNMASVQVSYYCHLTVTYI